MIACKGKLVYGNSWCYLAIEDDIVRYYQWFMKKRYHGGLRLHLPKVGPHVSVVRGDDIDPIDPEMRELYWRKYDGLEIDFTYDPQTIGFNGEYFWFDVFCPFLAEVRAEMGLTPKPRYDYHLTIGKLYPDDVEMFQTFLRLEEEYDMS